MSISILEAETMVSGVEKIFLVTKKILSVTKNMVSASQTILSKAKGLPATGKAGDRRRVVRGFSRTPTIT